jgi:hypothetical protein
MKVKQRREGQEQAEKRLPFSSGLITLSHLFGTSYLRRFNFPYRRKIYSWNAQWPGQNAVDFRSCRLKIQLKL